MSIRIVRAALVCFTAAFALRCTPLDIPGDNERCFSSLSLRVEETADVRSAADAASSSVGGRILLPNPIPVGYVATGTGINPDSHGGKPGFTVLFSPEGANDTRPGATLFYATRAECDLKIFPRGASSATVQVGDRTIDVSIEQPGAGKPGLALVSGTVHAGDLLVNLLLGWELDDAPDESTKLAVFKRWAESIDY